MTTTVFISSCCCLTYRGRCVHVFRCIFCISIQAFIRVARTLQTNRAHWMKVAWELHNLLHEHSCAVASNVHAIDRKLARCNCAQIAVHCFASSGYLPASNPTTLTTNLNTNSNPLCLSPHPRDMFYCAACKYSLYVDVRRKMLYVARFNKPLGRCFRKYAIAVVGRCVLGCV